MLSPAAAPQEPAPLAERLKDPANVWPAFQQFIRQGEYAKAHELLSPATRRSFPYEAFYVVFASYETPRRMVLTTSVHGVDPSGRIKLCGAEFGVAREIRLAKFMGKIWTLELSPDDVEYFKGRPLEWYRHQVKTADGWHFAYPPDWTYAPVRRHCACAK